MEKDPITTEPTGDPTWFRQPTRRERLIAAGLFVGFAVFFGLFSFVWAGSIVRWIVIGFAIASLYYGLRHAFGASAAR